MADAKTLDPVQFVQETLGEEPYEKQLEILKALGRGRRVSVVGCNSSGKDWTAARSVLWWVESRPPAKVVVTGPTARQVDDVVWSEIRAAYGQASDKLTGRMFRTSRYEVDDQSFALGFATNSPYNLQGFHSPNLFVVVTEAHAVPEDEIDALRRLQPSLILMTGNPFTSAGAFYDSHHSRRHLYETVRIGARDTPNVRERGVVTPGLVTPEDMEDRKQEWGEDSAMFVGSVLGKFPENLDGVVVPPWAAVEAAARELQAEGPVILGCDVARFGHAKTVVVRRQGPVARIVWRTRGNDTMEVARYLNSYCDQHRVDAVVVDDTGVGGGVVDRLRELRPRNARVVPFIGGKRAHDDAHFANRLAEVWWAMRTSYCNREIDTDDDAALIGQVSSRKYWWRDDERIVLESKNNMRSSPDEADALAMTFAADRGGVRIWV